MISNETPPPTSLLKLAGFPLVCVVDPVSPMEELFRRMSRLPRCVFFDSGLNEKAFGRYSFLAADPFDTVDVELSDAESALDELARRMEPFGAPNRPDLPPFQGGGAGVFGYELGGHLEGVESASLSDLPIPALSVGLYDVVIAIDHWVNQVWVISHGWPESNVHRRRARAHQRMKQFLSLAQSKRKPETRPYEAPERAEICTPHLPCPGRPGVFSNFTSEQYLGAVCDVVESIRSGEIFQANISQRLLCPATMHASELYLRLRESAKAPFAGYYEGEEFQVASMSPERFVSLRDRQVEARPIKGTRPMTQDSKGNASEATDLMSDAKERAENVMIVDLLRNDLSKVCLPDSVEVEKLCDLETYGYVQHLVSVIRGQLSDECGAIELIRATFPGGSVTGAPKRRAMQIIADVENVTRGAYCGAMGYIGWDSTMDLNLLIRTVTATRGWWQFPVGGGITAASKPKEELAETWHKAAGILAALSNRPD